MNRVTPVHAESLSMTLLRFRMQLLRGVWP